MKLDKLSCSTFNANFLANLIQNFPNENPKFTHITKFSRLDDLMKSEAVPINGKTAETQRMR